MVTCPSKTIKLWQGALTFMVTVEVGRQAVWDHCKEAGISDDIALIAKYFDIKDICVIFNGKMTYIHERPRKLIRVPANPVKIDYKACIQATKDAARRYK